MTFWEDDNDPIKEFSSPYKAILERVDEYSLYCFYLGFDPIPNIRKYTSPVRTEENYDDSPSFGVFYATKKGTYNEFFWKDIATGRKGDIFDLVQILHGLPTKQGAAEQIAIEFGLKPGIPAKRQLILVQKPELSDTHIEVKSRPFTFKELQWWASMNITEKILKLYRVSAISFYWSFVGQSVPKTAREFSFVYKVRNRHKLYFPFLGKKDKFRNDLGDYDIEGLSQLQFKSPVLIITKSMKDVMLLYSFGYEAIAPRSEHVMIPEDVIVNLFKYYKRIVVFFDNDGKHRAQDYVVLGCQQVEIDVSTGVKDPTDFCIRYGIPATKELLHELLDSYYYEQIAS